MNFDYQISIEATLTREEADIVYEHLTHHPDTKKHTIKGAFGFYFSNWFAGKDVKRFWESKEIDIMLKSLEAPLYWSEDQKDLRKVKEEIISKLYSWNRYLSIEFSRIKKQNK